MAAAPTDPVSLITLGPGESVLGKWEGRTRGQEYLSPPSVLLLTGQRVLVVVPEGKAETLWRVRFNISGWKIVLDRTLANMGPVRFYEDKDQEETGIAVAGQTFSLDTADLARAVRDDLESARWRALGLSESTDPHAPRERQVIIKEIVKVPCRFCDNLNLQTDKKCSSCGAAFR